MFHNVFKGYWERIHCVKSVPIRSYSGPYFPAFRLNAGKYQPEIIPYLDNFHAVIPAIPCINSVYHGFEGISNLGPRTWSLVPDRLK